MPSLDTGRRRRAHLDYVGNDFGTQCMPSCGIPRLRNSNKEAHANTIPPEATVGKPPSAWCDARLVFTVPRRRSTYVLANSEPRTGNINPTRGLDVCFVAQRITQTLVKQCLDEHTRTHVRTCWEAPSMRTAQHAHTENLQETLDKTSV